MYVCPHCHEEIPDRVKKSKDECPFCHEPWPPEPEPQEAPEPAQAGGVGGFPGGGVPASQPEIDHGPPIHQPKSKAKLWIILALLLVVVGGGGTAAYLFLFKDGKKSSSASITVTVGKEKVTLKKVYGEEYEAMVNWHNEVRKTVLQFLASRCDPYRKKGFKFASRLVTREKLVSATRKIKKLELEIQQKTGTAVPIKGFNWFRCPGILAFVHKEHEMTIEMGFSIKERTLGSDIRKATIEIKGGKFVGGKGKYRAYWDMGRSGLRFPGLKKAVGDKAPWLMKLRANSADRKDDDLFHLAGVPFKRTASGRNRSKSFLVGKWKTTMSTDTFKDLLNTWSAACRRVKKKVRSINKKYKEAREKFKIPLLQRKAVDVTVKLCKGMRKIAKSVEPWKAEDINAGRKMVIEGLNEAKDLLRKPLVALGKKIKNDLKPHFWCGDYKKSGSECK